ncbi:hypothetical protein [Solitalea lacus]|uniref:hypothetical protein n=1 Tax=Solitalea lacus TaxID=2911172 RepID=UPI001EDB4592|nr:hypothetical protein [Solitalea lacus]UKJ06293.1 hypothetical protein L2B55_12175 [Solitalea lacus]
MENLPGTSRHWLLLLILCVASMITHAQGKKWHYIVEPYILFPNMHGTIGLGNLPDADIDENPGDIFNHLQLGAMLYAEATNNKWTISSDLLYMDLGEDVTSSSIISSGDVDARQLGWEVDGLYKVLPWLDVGAGAILNAIKSEANLTVNSPTGPSELNREISKTWVDPALVARAMFPLDKWLFQLRGNIGGFGLGSDLAWQLQGYATYRFSNLFMLTAGYRVFNIDYSSGSGQDRLLYDVTTFGPVIKFGFNF